MTWITKLYNNKFEGPWKEAMTNIFNSHRCANQGIHIFETNTTQIKKLPPFYEQLLKNWREIKDIHKKPINEIEEILNQPLFYNNKIKTQNTKFLIPNKNHIKNEIIIVADLAKTFLPGYLHHSSIGLTANEMSDIVKSLPEEWQKKICSENQTYDHKKYPFYIYKKKEKYEYKNLSVSTLYKILNNAKKQINYKYKNWAHYGDSMKNISEVE